MKAAEKFQQETKRFIRTLRLVSLYSILTNICMLVLPIFMFNIYRTVLPSHNLATLLSLFLFALIMLGAMVILDASRQMILQRSAARFESEMIGYVVTGELNRPQGPRQQTIGELLAVKQIFSSPSFVNLFDLPTTPLFLLFIFLIHFVLGFTVLLGILALAGLTLWADRKTAPYLEDNQKEQFEAQQSLRQHFSMQEYIRSQGLFREVLEDWGYHQRKFLEGSLALGNHAAVHGGIAKASRQLFQILLVSVGALLVLAGDADIIIVIAVTMIGGRALAPIDSLIGSWRNLRQGYNAYRSLQKRLGELAVPEAVTPLPAPKGHLAVERLTYMTAPGQPPILRGIDFAVQAGEIVAVVGPSGAGKSTLAKILVGFLEPSLGGVKLDGQELKAWDPIARGCYIGYVPQKVDFFEATIQENIASLRRNDPKEWAVQAAVQAGVHEMILAMPKGYDTPLSRMGFWPSGGQSQLIGLARAFYGSPKVLVLDEPNAALDQAGEQTFHRSLLAAKKQNITTVIITQRPAVLRFADKILVLQAGQMKDFGPKEKILGNSVQTGGQRQVGAVQTEKTARGAAPAQSGKAAPAQSEKAAGASSAAQSAPTQSDPVQSDPVSSGEATGAPTSGAPTSGTEAKSDTQAAPQRAGASS